MTSSNDSWTKLTIYSTRHDNNGICINFPVQKFTHPCFLISWFVSMFVYQLALLEFFTIFNYMMLESSFGCQDAWRTLSRKAGHLLRTNKTENWLIFVIYSFSRYINICYTTCFQEECKCNIYFIYIFGILFTKSCLFNCKKKKKKKKSVYPQCVFHCIFFLVFLYFFQRNVNVGQNFFFNPSLPSVTKKKTANQPFRTSKNIWFPLWLPSARGLQRL